MSETIIRSRIDSATKLEAQILLKRLGLSMSDAIRLFLNQVVLEKGLPFQVKLPEGAANEHDRWFRQQVEAAVEEADNPENSMIPHEKIASHWADKKKSLMSEVEGKKP